jgi:hypothetical protein
MPPTCPVAPPCPPAPAVPPFPPLSKDEDELLDIAIRLDSTLQEFTASKGKISEESFVKSIYMSWQVFYLLGILLILTCGTQMDVECICTASTIPGGPRMHAIIKYIGGEVAEAGKAKRRLNLHTLSLSTVEEWCTEAGENCPTETGVIHIPDLRPLLHYVPSEYRWWLPAISHDDVEMQEGGGETPRCQTRSSKHAIMSPGSRAPDAQHARVEDPVCCSYIIPSLQLTFQDRMLVANVQ